MQNEIVDLKRLLMENSSRDTIIETLRVENSDLEACVDLLESSKTFQLTSKLSHNKRENQGNVNSSVHQEVIDESVAEAENMIDSYYKALNPTTCEGATDAQEQQSPSFQQQIHQ